MAPLRKVLEKANERPVTGGRDHEGKRRPRGRQVWPHASWRCWCHACSRVSTHQRVFFKYVHVTACQSHLSKALKKNKNRYKNALRDWDPGHRPLDGNPPAFAFIVTLLLRSRQVRPGQVRPRQVEQLSEGHWILGAEEIKRESRDFPSREFSAHCQQVSSPSLWFCPTHLPTFVATWFHIGGK